MTGGRDYADLEAVEQTFRREATARGWSKESLIVINGGAKGLDTLVAEYCHGRGVACATVPANWDIYGKAAGMLRNNWMLLLQPELLLSFPGGAGTAGMTRLADEAGIEVIQCS